MPEHSGSPFDCPVCAPLGTARAEANQASRDVSTFGRFAGYNSPAYRDAKRAAQAAADAYLLARREHLAVLG